MRGFGDGPRLDPPEGCDEHDTLLPCGQCEADYNDYMSDKGQADRENR